MDIWSLLVGISIKCSFSSNCKGSLNQVCYVGSEGIYVTQLVSLIPITQLTAEMR